MHAVPNPYLSVDDHIWRTLLWVSSFCTARISGCLGHVCLSSLRLQGQEQKSALPQAAMEHGKDMQLPPMQIDKDGTGGITLQTSPHAGFYHSMSKLVYGITPQEQGPPSHTQLWFGSLHTHTHLSYSSEVLS